MIRTLARNGLVDRSIAARHCTPGHGRLRHRLAPSHSEILSCLQRQNLSWSISARYLATQGPPTDKGAQKSSNVPPPSKPPHKGKVSLKPAPIKPTKQSTSTSGSSASSSTAQPAGVHESTASSSTPSRSVAAEVRAMNEHDMEIAAQHGLLAPAPPNVGRVKKMIHQLKELFKFYMRGIKMVWDHRKRVQEIETRVKDGGYPMTRWEKNFVLTHQRDKLKIVPFLLIVLVVEEIIPLIVLYAPSMLPSTCILPSQRERIDKKRYTKQMHAADDFWVIIAKIDEQGRGTGYIRIEDLTSLQTTAMCKLLAISTFGLTNSKAHRLRRRLEFIAEDDEMLRREGNGERLSNEEVVEALQARALMTKLVPPAKHRSLLKYWLDTLAKPGKGDPVSRRIAFIAVNNGRRDASSL